MMSIAWASVSAALPDRGAGVAPDGMMSDDAFVQIPQTRCARGLTISP
jgi:hypothetical protein